MGKEDLASLTGALKRRDENISALQGKLLTTEETFMSKIAKHKEQFIFYKQKYKELKKKYTIKEQENMDLRKRIESEMMNALILRDELQMAKSAAHILRGKLQRAKKAENLAAQQYCQSLVEKATIAMELKKQLEISADGEPFGRMYPRDKLSTNPYGPKRCVLSKSTSSHNSGESQKPNNTERYSQKKSQQI